MSNLWRMLMYNPFEEKISKTKLGKEFKGVTDLLLTLDGRLSPDIIDMLLDNVYHHYVSGKKNEFEILHETLWNQGTIIVNESKIKQTKKKKVIRKRLK